MLCALIKCHGQRAKLYDFFFLLFWLHVVSVTNALIVSTSRCVANTLINNRKRIDSNFVVFNRRCINCSNEWKTRKHFLLFSIYIAIQYVDKRHTTHIADTHTHTDQLIPSLSRSLCLSYSSRIRRLLILYANNNNHNIR